MKTLTDRAFWDRGWGQQGRLRGLGLSTRLHEREMSRMLARALAAVPQGGRLVEIGGAPGDTLALYHRLRPDVQCDCLDYSPVGVEKTRARYAAEGIPGEVVEADYRDYVNDAGDRYDLVCSHGFVEHFEDFGAVIAGHVGLVKPGGTILVTVPDLSVAAYRPLLNRFAREMVDAHNFACMRTEALGGALRQAGVEAVETGHFGAALVPHDPVDPTTGGRLFQRAAQVWNLQVAALAALSGGRATARLWNAHLFAMGRRPAASAAA